MVEMLKAGKALLLLDALDETVIGPTAIAAEDSYQRVAHAIIQVVTRYNQSPIVVTVRKAAYQERIRLIGFTELEVLDFQPDDIKKFVNNWFSYQPRTSRYANAKDLNNKLERNPRIQVLASNPLLLSLIVIV